MITYFLSALCVWGAVAAAPVEHPFESSDHTRNAFGNPFPKLNREERREFYVGNSFFKQSWVQAGSSTPARDGLGPTFNAISCSSCHLLDGRGPGADHEGFAHVSLLFRLEGAQEKYGNQVNPFGITDVPGEAEPYVSFIPIKGEFPDGEKYELRQPIYRLVNWLLGDPDADTRISPRVANQLIGLGILEEIPESELLALADPDDRDGDGISGRLNYVLDLRSGKIVPGRFGWKAEQPTVEQQSAAAFNGDIGITTHLFPEQNCPAPQKACAAAPQGGSPEVDDLILARVTLYMRSLAVPIRRTLTQNQGEALFTKIGCTSCHHPSYNVEGVAVFPYTDLLLHDMGPGLADKSFSGQILPTEWRTPALWGIGLLPVVNGHQNLLHDGRARGVQEAILWHDGEGRSARDAFIQLSAQERVDLIEFVNSL